MYLEYNDVPFEKITYTKECTEKWLEEDKKNQGIAFPNLPYLIDGDLKLSQSNSIMKYLEKKYGSYFTGDLAHDIKFDILLESIVDIRGPFTNMCYGEGEMAKKKDAYLSPRTLFKWEYFDGYLKDKKYLTGDSLCAADFAFWNLVDYNHIFDPKILENYTNIMRFKKDFESEPKIEAYLKNPSYKQFPINGWMAEWGGQDQAD